MTTSIERRALLARDMGLREEEHRERITGFQEAKVVMADLNDLMGELRPMLLAIKEAVDADI